MSTHKASPILLVIFLSGCISAETQRALDDATARVAALHRAAEEVRLERDVLREKFETGKISLSKYETEHAKLMEKITGLEVERAVSEAELTAAEEKARLEREGSLWGILSGIDTTLEIGAEVAAGVPAVAFLSPLLGLVRMGIGVFLRKKGGADA